MPEPFASSRTRFYHRGRYAIWHALRALGLGPGSNVAFPAFHCGAELIPFRQAGVGLRYYRLSRSLQADLDSIEGAIDPQTKAVFVTHCLGFPQQIRDIQQLCRERGLPLIEDCAHTLNGWSGDRMLGTFGDVAIFSMRKLLPMPHGAALCINTPSVPLPEAPRPPPLTGTVGDMAFKVGRHLADRNSKLGSIARTWIARPAARALEGCRGVTRGSERRPDSPLFRTDHLDRGMSGLSERILRTSDLEQVRQRRRRNFERLLAGLTATGPAEPLLPELPDGVCPLMFPLFADQAEDLVGHLRHHGIQSDLYWRYFDPGFPEHDFPEEADLKRRLLTLPVHQELDDAALDRMVGAVRSWTGPRS